MPTKTHPEKHKRSVPRKVSASSSLSRNQRQIYKAVAIADSNPVHLQSVANFDITEIVQTNREDEDKENLGI